MSQAARQTQFNPEFESNTPEPVRARHYDVNVAADDTMHVLETNYDLSQSVPASREVHAYEEHVKAAEKAVNPLFEQPPVNDMEADALAQLEKIFGDN